VFGIVGHQNETAGDGSEQRARIWQDSSSTDQSSIEINKIASGIQIEFSHI
jgi:hypothetical protein